MITANADSPPSNLCDGLTDCQNGRRASIGNYGTKSANHPCTISLPDDLLIKSLLDCGDILTKRHQFWEGLLMIIGTS